MKVLVTGASGFVGRWLRAELEGAGHLVITAPGRRVLDLAGADGPPPELVALLSDSRPDVVAHLAGMAFAPDATSDPGLAIRVNVGGTRAVLSALDAVGSDAAVLVTGSSDVYGRFEARDLPLTEAQPAWPSGPYGRSKLAQEEVALAAAARRPVVVTRAFNHIGPGQREVFVAPALARRVLAVKAGLAKAIPVGNVDVRRDLTDVRDVVVAYRLLLEALVAGRVPRERPIYNVATGRSVEIRAVLEILGELAQVRVVMEVEPSLVREGDAPDVRGDATKLHELTGWAPTIPLDTSLADLLLSLEQSPAATSWEPPTRRGSRTPRPR